MLVCWTTPRCNNYWRCLTDDWTEILAHSIEEGKDIIVVPGLQPPLYSLSYSLLAVYSHVFMAVNQILHGLAELAGLAQERAHRFDPNYQLTRLLDCGQSRAEVIVTFSLLKGRAMSSCDYILSRFQRVYRSLKNPYATRDDDYESTISYNSAVTAIRTRYGTRSPRTERARLLTYPQTLPFVPPHLHLEVEDLASYYHAETDGFDARRLSSFYCPSSPKRIHARSQTAPVIT